jgi:hypothetical protein
VRFSSARFMRSGAVLSVLLQLRNPTAPRRHRSQNQGLSTAARPVAKSLAACGGLAKRERAHTKAHN